LTKSKIFATIILDNKKLYYLKNKNQNKMSFTKNQANCFNLEQGGWKYYNSNYLRKKAVEQEFSWSGLFISLSIAFFIVIISASALSFINYSITASGNNQRSISKTASI